jgi:hypothetical protein
VWLSAFLLALTPLVYYSTLPISAGKEHYRRAGLWLAGRAAPDDIVVAHGRMEQVMYYAGRTWPRDAGWRRTKPEVPWDKVARVIEKASAAWYIDAGGSRRDYKMESELLAAVPQASRPALRVEHREAAEDGEVFIWRVERSRAPDKSASPD